MKTIKSTAPEMRRALLDGDLNWFAGLLNEKWESCKCLADGATTPQIYALMAAGKANGAPAGRICGAGGCQEPGMLNNTSVAAWRITDTNRATTGPVYVVPGSLSERAEFSAGASDEIRER